MCGPRKVAVGIEMLYGLADELDDDACVWVSSLLCNARRAIEKYDGAMGHLPRTGFVTRRRTSRHVDTPVDDASRKLALEAGRAAIRAIQELNDLLDGTTAEVVVGE